MEERDVKIYKMREDVLDVLSNEEPAIGVAVMTSIMVEYTTAHKKQWLELMSKLWDEYEVLKKSD